MWLRFDLVLVNTCLVSELTILVIILVALLGKCYEWHQIRRSPTLVRADSDGLLLNPIGVRRIIIPNFGHEQTRVRLRSDSKSGCSSLLESDQSDQTPV